MVGKDETMNDRLEWRDDMPYSTAFGDHYYSRADGRAECDHVFLKGNGLPARWRDTARFTVAELGFGTGLNFVETWRQWQACSGPASHLSFVSFEGFPLQAGDMARALGTWPDLSPFAGALAAAWPPHPTGTVTLALDDAVTLEVHIGDAQDMLSSWSGVADAWFLDGFAPARNGRMWSPELMRAVYRHTAPGGTFATYTAAGWVRRNLADAGFEVHKAAGFAGKRDMTQGVRREGRP